eukprot:TRINITY_DN6048_c0_g1_i4.p1 TRINITY_DN6048_c0_g1~~TRINITY_DN6048_c0_g1_i4.p1  ORF type:complete len:168 (-),score=34.72 TRINITY_DN6048_c0_g1_i4:91-594(-)
MLLLGTEVDGSCLHVNGVPSTTQCLLSYMLDGKNRAVCLIDKEGVVHARCIIRLLLQNNKTKTCGSIPENVPPCVYLFLEQLYYKFSLKKYENDLNNLFVAMGIRRARELNVPLVAVRGSIPQGRVLTGGPLYSADGHCIHEYVDAVRSRFSYFSIPDENCEVLWEP